MNRNLFNSAIIGLAVLLGWSGGAARADSVAFEEDSSDSRKTTSEFKHSLHYVNGKQLYSNAQIGSQFRQPFMPAAGWIATASSRQFDIGAAASAPSVGSRFFNSSTSFHAVLAGNSFDSDPVTTSKKAIRSAAVTAEESTPNPIASTAPGEAANGRTLAVLICLAVLALGGLGLIGRYFPISQRLVAVTQKLVWTTKKLTGFHRR